MSDGSQYTVTNECFAKDAKKWSDPWDRTQTEPYDRYDAMMKNFAELIGGKENPYSYDYELNLYKLILRACGAQA